MLVDDLYAGVHALGDDLDRKLPLSHPANRVGAYLVGPPRRRALDGVVV